MMISPTATLEGVCIPANSTAKSKFFSCGWMLHMKGTLLLIHSSCFGPYRALRQLSFGNICHPLEVVVAAIAEVCCSKAEEDCHAAAVSALVFQVICPMLRTHLSLTDIAAAPTDKFLRVESIPCSRVQVTPCLPAKVGLAALEADIVGVALHGKACWVVVPPRPLRAHGLTLRQTLILQTHQSFLSHILVKSLNGVQEIVESRVRHPHLADGTVGEAKTYPWPAPSGGQHGSAAMKMENMSTAKQYGGNGVERLCEANHTHVVRILPQLG